MKGRPVKSDDDLVQAALRHAVQASMKGRPLRGGDFEYRALRDTAQFEPR